MLFTFLCAAFAIPLAASAWEIHGIKTIKPIKPLDTTKVSMQFNALIESACRNLSGNMVGGFPLILPGFCPEAPPLPPPEPEGSVVINEIMYDPLGTDGSREWIEIKNGTNAPVDLSNWKLLESGTDHGLTLISGVAVVPAGGFVVVAANDVSFLVDWPAFTGTLFDSVFALVNTGETLALKNGAGGVVDEVTYSSTQGASNDGKSLQRILDSWVAALPTPGAGNVAP